MTQTCTEVLDEFKELSKIERFAVVAGSRSSNEQDVILRINATKAIWTHLSLTCLDTSRCIVSWNTFSSSCITTALKKSLINFSSGDKVAPADDRELIGYYAERNLNSIKVGRNFKLGVASGGLVAMK